MNTPVSILLVGAGQRGLFRYGAYVAEHPDVAKIVAVAEPLDWNRKETAKRFNIPSTSTFLDWREVLKGPRIADAVIIATQDQLHVEPAVAFLQAGYDVLLEKPMAPSEDECRQIAAAAAKNPASIFMVCHVLRYTPYFRKVKDLVQSGRLGQVVTLRHMEQVGTLHQAHSYVRGNWRRADQSAPMILAKSCHDLDILLFILGKRCTRLSSFGSLRHFRKQNKPAEATARCLDCPLAESKCHYSATRYYLGKLRESNFGWPLEVITNDFTEAGVTHALRDGPYGRCVYDSDNDVVDHQVVSMEFEQGITASFTMTAFALQTGRKTEIFGSMGELRGDGQKIEVTDFLTGSKEIFSFIDPETGSVKGHMGGDEGIMADFINAVSSRNKVLTLSDPSTSLESHLMAFAAERARLAGTVEQIIL